MSVVSFVNDNAVQARTVLCKYYICNSVTLYSTYMLFDTYLGAAIQDGGSDLNFEVPAKKSRMLKCYIKYRQVEQSL